MQHQDLTNSPTRNIVKRKMPESFYKPPVLKTQVCSLEAINQSHHAHTFSLPSLNDPTNKPLQHHGNNSHMHSATTTTGSTGSLNDPSHFNTNFNTTHGPVNAFNNNSFASQQHQMPPSLQQQQLHAKTFSLPVSFDPNTYLVNSRNDLNATSSTSSMAQLQPPSSNFNQCIDVPLPPGWQAEKTPTGQIYFINHLTKTTTWDDPRQLYNLPSNQNEIGHELRLKISQSIPLPHNWEEARNANGDVYFINHNNRTTCWEDPRLTIYMQQQQTLAASLDRHHHQQSDHPNKNEAFGGGMVPFLNSAPSSSSSSSINNSSSSLYSRSSPSLHSSTSSISQSQYDHKNNTNNNNLTTTNTYPKSTQIPFTNTTNTTLSNLITSLEQVIAQKKIICSQLDELNRKEMLVKSKMSQKDLDDVLRVLKEKDNSMNGFAEYNNSSCLITKLTSHHHKENQLNENVNETTVDLDSTLVVADSSANNLNTSN